MKEMIGMKNFEDVTDLDRIGIPTARMVVPGMEVYCLDNSRRGERLYNALEKRG